MNSVNDAVFKDLQDDLSCLNDIVTDIADKEREKNRLIQKILIRAANYYTKEEIELLHDQSIEVLKSNDFEKETMIKHFNDTSTMTIDEVMFLIQRQNQISNAMSMLQNDPAGTRTQQKSFLELFAEMLKKGGDNNA